MVCRDTACRVCTLRRGNEAQQPTDISEPQLCSENGMSLVILNEVKNLHNATPWDSSLRSEWQIQRLPSEEHFHHCGWA